jgi:hypothetical protein
MKFKLIYSVFIIGIISCKKEVIPPDPPYIEQWWEEYYGEYFVTDTLNDTNYTLRISKISRSFDGQFFHDSILVENFAGKFNLTIGEPQLYGANLSIGSIDKAIDNDGLSWSLSGTHYWSEENDTLKLFYTLSNIAHYLEDGVDFYEVTNTDLALKVQ